MSIEFEQIGVNLAACVTGVDFSNSQDSDTVATLLQAHAEHQVLVFPDQELTAEQFVAVGRQMGELTVHPFSPHDEETHELITFRNDETSAPFHTDIWHSDETFRLAPPMGTMLHAQLVPKIGGDTVFASMIAAYEGLSDRMQHFISGLVAVHDMKPFRSLFGDTDEGRKRMQEFELRYPPAHHPVVREHPITGKKLLFVNPQFTVAIDGMGEEESRSLLEQLFRQAWLPEYQYRHKHEANNLVFWDNRSVQHYAVHDYYPHKRHMQRVTLKGDPPFGPHGAEHASLRSKKSAFVAMREEGDAGGHVPHE
jgi:taurine dioxygenase